MEDYDHLRGYLHSRHLRWSYGAMKGRPADWAAQLRVRGLALVVPAVAASGFDGIYVDRDGYGDDGRATEAKLRRLVGATPLLGSSGRQLFFDLRAYAQRLRREFGDATLQALRTATLRPVVVEEGDGLSPLSDIGVKSWRDGEARAELRLVNRFPFPKPVKLAGRLERPSGETAWVTMSFPDGSSTALKATFSGTPFRRALELAPGTNIIRFAVDDPPPTQPALPWFRLADFTVTDDVFERFLSTRAASEVEPAARP